MPDMPEDEILDIPVDKMSGKDLDEALALEYWLEVQNEYNAELKEEQRDLEEAEEAEASEERFEAAMREDW